MANPAQKSIISEKSQLATSQASQAGDKSRAGNANSKKEPANPQSSKNKDAKETQSKRGEAFNAEVEAKKAGGKVFNTEMSIAAGLTEYYDPAPQSNRAGPPPGISKPDEEQKTLRMKEAATKIAQEMLKEKDAATTGRRLFVMRHAERMDRIFPGMQRLAFTDMGLYKPYDLNMPVNLPKRDCTAFENDCTITEMGHVTAQMIGRGMRLNQIIVSHIFCSPALRCIQSAHGLLKTMNVAAKICVEPGLFEWMKWYSKPPRWMSPEELQDNSYRINTDYKPVMTVQDVYARAQETAAEHYERQVDVIKKILENTPNAANILILGHGTTIDSVPRFLLGKDTSKDLNNKAMERLGLHYPYCSVVAIEEMKDKKWRSIHNPIPPITYLDFSNRVNPQHFNR